jgi:hypothetical protein
MKYVMIAGLLAAIGAVAFAGQSHAGNRYCSYYPEDPNCYGALYGQESYGQSGAYQDPRQDYDDDEFNGADDNNHYQVPLQLKAQPVKSCQSVGRELRQFGYRNVRALECGGRNYRYVAYLGYQRFMVKVNSRSGAIVYEINY